MKILSSIARWLWVALLFLGASPAPMVTAAQTNGICDKPDRSVSTPLTDLGNRPYMRMDGTVTEFTGGLYPNGSNTRPPGLEAAALAQSAQITPLDKYGNPDPDGKIVLISIGMSNADAEFTRFISLVQGEAQINPNLVLVNSAVPGGTAERWVDPQDLTWQESGFRLMRASLSALQVQAAWVKQTLTGGGSFPARTQDLQKDLEDIARNLKLNFPNLKIAYFSSRTRSFTYERGLSPEPLAFEGGFAVKWLIEKQMSGDPALNYDPQRGEVVAPLLVWGPYLWIDGGNPRSDGRTWLAEDMALDCTHPSELGRTKVAEMLLEFFKSDPSTMSWFLAGGSPPAVVQAPGSPTHTPAATATTAPLPTKAAAATSTPGEAGTPTAVLPAAQSLTPEPGPPVSPGANPPQAGGDSTGASTRAITLALAGVGLFGAGFAAGWYFAIRRRMVR